MQRLYAKIVIIEMVVHQQHTDLITRPGRREKVYHEIFTALFYPAKQLIFTQKFSPTGTAQMPAWQVCP